MEFARTLLLSALFLVAFILWYTWENERSTRRFSAQSNTNSSSVNSGIPQFYSAEATITPLSQGLSHTQQRWISVKTDVLEVIIDTVGGNLVQANLLGYAKTGKITAQSEPFQLLSNDPQCYYVAQSGLISSLGPDSQQGQAIYHSRQAGYTLASHQNRLVVDLYWAGKTVYVHKQFVFKRSDYTVELSYQVTNRGPVAWEGQLYTQFQRKKPEQANSLFNIASYTGGAISSQMKPYEKISFDKMAETRLNITSHSGWIAMLQHYFLSAWIPDQDSTFRIYSDRYDNIYTLGILGPTLKLQPGSRLTTGAKLYLGPEIMDHLRAVAPNLDLTIDYGILWFFSIALLWLLKQMYRLVGNWGWAIVMVTVLIKVGFYHLSAKSYRSMAAMRDLQPRLQRLRECYKDDKQKMTQATLQLYKQAKINPLGGCLPVLIQIPVFIALYWVLLESIELRQAPFILWINDLSTKDPYYILPILMGFTMFIQQKLNPSPVDPMQAKLMFFLPFFFTILFLNFPAGLILYWFVSNTLSILQQWMITGRAAMLAK